VDGSCLSVVRIALEPLREEGKGKEKKSIEAGITGFETSPRPKKERERDRPWVPNSGRATCRSWGRGKEKVEPDRAYTLPIISKASASASTMEEGGERGAVAAACLNGGGGGRCGVMGRSTEGGRREKGGMGGTGGGIGWGGRECGSRVSGVSGKECWWEHRGVEVVRRVVNGGGGGGWSGGLRGGEVGDIKH